MNTYQHQKLQNQKTIDTLSLIAIALYTIYAITI